MPMPTRVSKLRVLYRNSHEISLSTGFGSKQTKTAQHRCINEVSSISSKQLVIYRQIWPGFTFTARSAMNLHGKILWFPIPGSSSGQFPMKNPRFPPWARHKKSHGFHPFPTDPGPQNRHGTPGPGNSIGAFIRQLLNFAIPTVGVPLQLP